MPLFTHQDLNFVLNDVRASRLRIEGYLIWIRTPSRNLDEAAKIAENVTPLNKGR